MNITQAFKNIDNKLWKGGVANALDYMEQSSWILFLKYLSDQEKDREFEARDIQDRPIDIIKNIKTALI